MKSVLALALAFLPSARAACDMCAVTNGAMGPLKADAIAFESGGKSYTCQDMQTAGSTGGDTTCASYGAMYGSQCCEYEIPTTCPLCGAATALPEPLTIFSDPYTCWGMELSYNKALDDGTNTNTCAEYQTATARQCCGAGGACFAGDMTAQLESGEAARMDALQLGDRVLTADGSYSDVHLFSKRDARTASYVVLATEQTEIAVSADHYVQLNGEMQLARYAKVGDMLSAGAIVSVTEEQRLGAFSPITLAGDIVVNGVVASSYTKKVNPVLSHMLLAPRRLAYAVAPETMNWLAEECTSGCDTVVRMAKVLKRGLSAAGLAGVASLIGEQTAKA